MSMNYAFGFSLFLLILVGLNIYFFYTLNAVGRRTANFNVPSIKLDLAPSVSKDIYDHLNYLPSQYKNKHPKFAVVQRNLIHSFNSSNVDIKNIWHDTENWNSEESLFPHENGAAGRLLQSIRATNIELVDNAPKGTQLKLLLLLEGKQKLYFKPKRYELNNVIRGTIYAGFDRHNSEVFAYYLAMVMNFKWIAPSVIRRIHIHRDIEPVATLGLRRTMVKNESGSLCIYGMCFYCKINETVCPDVKGEIEGAAILYLDRQFRIHKSPWRRSYNSRKLDWEKDNDFCKKVVGTLSTKRILNLIDVSIFDFLIQNGDRHRYEVYKDKIVLLDNGKGLGNPNTDELDILAPLYQCCMLSLSTWQHLEILSGGVLSESIKLLSSFQGEKLATEDHFKAVERRLLKVYATIQYCIGKHGSAKDHQLDFIKYSDHWRGTSATIVPTKDSYVWGAIWRVHNTDLPALDKQEGVDTNWYFAKSVEITTLDGMKVECRTYQQSINPPIRSEGEEIPVDRRPSITYLDCILNGAMECELPDDYIQKLKKIPHNGQEASPKIIEKLKK